MDVPLSVTFLFLTNFLSCTSKAPNHMAKLREEMKPRLVNRDAILLRLSGRHVLMYS